MDPQRLKDLENLVALAKGLGVHDVVYSVAKITQRRKRKLSATMQAMRDVYAEYVLWIYSHAAGLLGPLKQRRKMP